jgi:hypothetical protein
MSRIFSLGMHFLYKSEWNWNSVNQNPLWCSARTLKQEKLGENSSKWESNRNFNVLLFVPFKCTLADFLFLSVNFWIRQYIFDLCGWTLIKDLIWCHTLTNGSQVPSILTSFSHAWKKTDSSRELVNSCVFPYSWIWFKLMHSWFWGTELVQGVATDCFHYDTYLRQ